MGLEVLGRFGVGFVLVVVHVYLAALPVDHCVFADFLGASCFSADTLMLDLWTLPVLGKILIASPSSIFATRVDFDWLDVCARAIAPAYKPTAAPAAAVANSVRLVMDMR